MQSGRKRILAGRIADARSEREAVAVTIEDGQITELATWNADTTPELDDIDARDCLLLPGFIDIHVHGGNGRYVMEGTEESLREIALHLARHGVTSFLATTVTGPKEQEAAAVQAAAVGYWNAEEWGGAQVLGVHLEGPFINPIKKGAQPEEYIRSPDKDLFQYRLGPETGLVRIVTLAPELPGALEFIRFLTANRIIASIGHTNATYDEVSAAIDAGARHVTHCFNAMRPMEGREPGVVGAAFARPELMAELIWDNHHVHPASCSALVSAKGPEGVILISDGIPGVGKPEGYEFSLGDLPVTVQNGTARLPDGTLAGSLLTLERAFANASQYTLSQRAAMTSYNAAIALRTNDCKGLLAPGYQADLVLLNADGSVRQTLVGGRIVYDAQAD